MMTPSISKVINDDCSIAKDKDNGVFYKKKVINDRFSIRKSSTMTFSFDTAYFYTNCLISIVI